MDHLRDSKGKAKKQTTWHSKRRTTSRIDARSSSQSSDDIANLHTINLIAAKWNTNIDRAPASIHSILGPLDQIQMSLLSVQYIHSNPRSIPIPTAYPRQRSISLLSPFIASKLSMRDRALAGTWAILFSLHSIPSIEFSLHQVTITRASGHNQRKENCSGSGESTVTDI